MSGPTANGAWDERLERRRIARLTEWFDRHQRDLPWRSGRRTGYTVLVAEAMLHQTQVSRVVEPYRRFLRRFPNARRLAAADEQSVLAAWQGLGYYRRARHLHAAAKAIVAHHGGRTPSKVEDLLGLPGVGRYTAGAIASIAFDQPEPIVDGNVARVLARWDAVDTPPEDRSAIAATWRRSEELVAQAKRPGRFNEALMELGATICTPRAPRCGQCPVAAGCRARALGRQSDIPPPKTPPRQRAVHHHSVIVRRGERILLEQRGANGLWSSMWQPPTVESTRPLTPGRVKQTLARRGTPLSRLTREQAFVHQTTHRHVTFHVFTGATRIRRGKWQPTDRLDELPMSNPHRRMVEELQSCNRR